MVSVVSASTRAHWYVDPHAATQLQQHFGVAAFGFGAGPGRAGDYPDGPSVYGRVALEPQVEQCGYFRKESEFAPATCPRFVQSPLFLGGRFGTQPAGLPIEFFLLAALLFRAERLAIPLQRAAVRLSVQHQRFPGFPFRGFHFAAGVEVRLHGVRLPGVVFHAHPVKLVLCNGTAYQLVGILRPGPCHCYEHQ
jgi:hypothetical protein